MVYHWLNDIFNKACFYRKHLNLFASCFIMNGTLNDIFIKACFYRKHLNLFASCFIMNGTWILFEKFYLYVPPKYHNYIGVICGWIHRCGKYVMKDIDWQLINWYTFYNQYIVYIDYPYKTFCQFPLALYFTHIFHCFARCLKRHIDRI